MRWDDFRSSDNVEDRRGGGGGGGGFGIPMGGGGLGIGAIIVLTLAGWALGIDPRILIGGGESMMGGGAPQEQTQRAPQGRSRGAAGRPRRVSFAAKVLGNTEDVWKVVLPAQINKPYVAAEDGDLLGRDALALRRRALADGPVLLPARPDGLYRPLLLPGDAAQVPRRRRLRLRLRDRARGRPPRREPARSARRELQQRQREVGEPQANQLSVRVELMADCLAGVWANHSNQQYQSLEEGDVEEAMKAAEAIGDDRLQKQAQGYAVPDSFTHGSSAQRVRWFMNGLKNGQVQQCDTFRAARL